MAFFSDVNFKMFDKICYLLLFLIILLNDSISVSQELDSEEFLDRLDRLERNIRDLQKEEFGKIKDNLVPSYISRNETRFDQIETDNKMNFGKNEELENKILELENKLNLINEDFEIRFKDIEEMISKINKGYVSQKERILDQIQDDSNPVESFEIKPLDQNKLDLSDSNKIDNTISAKDKYSNAIDLLWRNKFDQALSELEMLKKMKPIDLMPNIQYWLGEVYYAKKDFQQAIIEFGEGLKKYPNSIKGPDNMLKLGLSFSNLKKKTEACNVFIELELKYPDASANVLARSIQERKKLGCIKE